MANTKPYVRIQSTISINVTMGLQNQDVTNKDAHIPDRLKVNALWPKATMLIRQGVGIYPSEIVEWDTVKSLAKDKILTIGEYVDAPEAKDDEEKAEQFRLNLEEVKAAQKTQSLADIAK